mgnify:CR=1 FL=1
MSHAFTMFDPQTTRHQLAHTQRFMEQADIDAQRAAKRAVVQRMRENEAYRAHVLNQRTNRTWVNDHDRSRRILSARSYGPWRDAFERTVAMHHRMPLDGLQSVVERQCESLKPIMGFSESATFSAIIPDLDAGAIGRAFKNVQCALRQMESDCTTTSKRQTMRAMLRLSATIAAQFEIQTGGTVETPYQFAYPE